MSQIILRQLDNGANDGSYILIGRNTNGTTPAAGYVNMVARTDVQYTVWPDNAGMLRIATVLPTNANDTSGVVVGTQVSKKDSKHILGDVIAGEASLQYILAAAAVALKKFKYKNDAFNGQEFEGLVVDDAPRYGLDRDAENPAGKSLNIIVLFNDLIQSVAVLSEQINTLTERVAVLEKK